MAHPFEKMFDKALKKSTGMHNEVLVQAEKLRAKGYRDDEIEGVLQKLKASLVQDEDAAIVAEALAGFSGEDEDEEK